MGRVPVIFCLFSIISTIGLCLSIAYSGTESLQKTGSTPQVHAGYTHFFLYINGFPLFPDFRYEIFAVI